MFERRSLKFPITLGVLMITLLVALLVGWVLLAVFAALKDRGFAPIYWTLLAVGSLSLITVLVGVVLYLALSIKAIRLNQRQSNFIDSVTHELKSPIASLKLYLQTLRRQTVSDEEREAFVRFMLDDLERLDELINHLLDAGRVDKPPDEMDVERVRVDELLRECAEAVCLRHRTAREQVTLDLTPAIVEARRVDLEMIFRNLIDNAVKYAGEPPEVVVTCHVTPDNWLVTEIADNGPGIPRSERNRVFRRFVRLGLELERQKPGTGLGLYIVRTLVRRQRGRIRVHDRKPAKGTVFEVRLPGTRAAPYYGCEPPPQHEQPSPAAAPADR